MPWLNLMLLIVLFDFGSNNLSAVTVRLARTEAVANQRDSPYCVVKAEDELVRKSALMKVTRHD